MSPRTIDEIRQRHASMYRAKGRPAEVVMSPDEWAPLFTSRLPECLTHITRYAVRYPAWPPWDEYVIGQAWCGIGLNARPIQLDEASGFACHACIAKAEKYGQPTYNLIPDTGCAVSNGKRGLNAGKKYTHPYARRESYR
jgi:hypothetical protein